MPKQTAPSSTKAPPVRWRRSSSAAAVTERIAACRYPDDDKFLELSVNGMAEVIVPGDADLLAHDTFRGISIVTAAAFVAARVRPGVV